MRMEFLAGTARRFPISPLDSQDEGVAALPLTVKRSGSQMPEPPSGLVQGTLDMLILKILALEPLHGYGITLRIEQVSRGVFRLNPGSLLPALRRMERAGWVRGGWRATENNRRARYYAITEQGRRALARETREWGRQTAAIASVLETS